MAGRGNPLTLKKYGSLFQKLEFLLNPIIPIYYSLPRRKIMGRKINFKNFGSKFKEIEEIKFIKGNSCRLSVVIKVFNSILFHL